MREKQIDEKWYD